ncbi:MAG: DNA-binding protein [Propionivibrio sp.]
MRRAAHAADGAASYQGEHLNFDTPAAFFSQLTEKRWMIVHTLQGAGTVGVRELARRVGRDVKRVHEDAAALVNLGLIERSEKGELVCPFSDIHVDMHLLHAA